MWVGIGKYAKYKQNMLVYVPKEYKENVESCLKEYSKPNNIVHEDTEELKNISNDEEKVKKEYTKKKRAKKILEWMPLGFILIIIICWIIMRQKTSKLKKAFLSSISSISAGISVTLRASGGSGNYT